MEFIYDKVDDAKYNWPSSKQDCIGYNYRISLEEEYLIPTINIQKHEFIATLTTLDPCLNSSQPLFKRSPIDRIDSSVNHHQDNDDAYEEEIKGNKQPDNGQTLPSSTHACLPVH